MASRIYAQEGDAGAKASSWLLSYRGIPLAIAAYVLFAVLARISAARAARKFSKENGCAPPRARLPLKDPFWGVDFISQGLAAFKGHRLMQLACDRHEKLGTTFSVHGIRASIWTIDPENIKTVLAVKFKDYGLGGRRIFMGPLLGRGIFVTDGEDWAHSRAMLRPNFAKDQVTDLEMVSRHISHLMKLIPNGTTVDLQPLLHRLTLDSATEFLLGHSTNTLVDVNPEGQAFSDAFNAASSHIAYMVRLGPFRHFTLTRKKANRDYAICRQYVDRFVDRAMALRKSSQKGEEAFQMEDDTRNYFLKELAKSNEPEERIRDELLNILVAGRDTTASLLGSFFFLVARRPEVWQKLRAEVKELEGRQPTYEQLRNLKYAKYCLNETLRLYPPVPGNARFAVRDTVLPRGGGPNGDKPLHVPKGGMVNYTVFAMHRRKDLYGPDAEEFRPERWETIRPSWEYLPFNGGPRICLGQQYALTEALLVVVRFVQRFSSIESRDPSPWTEQLGLTVCLHNGVLVSFPSDE